MQKLNYLLLCAAGLTLASCANEDLVSNSSDGTATVVLNLDLPQIQSRSYSDGTSANDLHYAVYVVDESGNPKSYLEGHTHNDDGSSAYDVETINLKKQLTFKLVTGRKYGFVFWADNENAPYNVTFNEQGATMSVDYSNPIPANNETLDAFYAYETLDVDGDTQMDVKLYRPFAQINVGANDYEDAKKSNYVPTESYMSVKNVYTNLSLLSGGVDTPQDITFAYAPIPEDETFPVDGYDYLAMAYVLVDKEQALTTVAFDTQDASEEKAAVRTVSSVPVKRNHRTNIYGQLFTNNVDIFIEIVPAYDEEDYPYSPFQELVMSAKLGGTYTLSQDVTVPDGKQVVFDKNSVINLDGHTISGSTDGLFYVTNGAQVTIKGNGTMEISDASKMSRAGEEVKNLIYVDEGKVIIMDGTFNGGLAVDDTKEADIVVNGGKYSIDPSDFVSAGNKSSEHRDGTFEVIPEGEALTEVGEDGKVICVDPVLPEGVTEATLAGKGGVYVDASGVAQTFEATGASVNEAMKNADVIYFTPNSTITTGAHIMNVPKTGITVYGNGATISGGENDFALQYTAFDANSTVDVNIYDLNNVEVWGGPTQKFTLNLYMKNCTFVGPDLKGGRSLAMVRGGDYDPAVVNITLDNCYGYGMQSALHTTYHGKTVVKNCKFETVGIPVNIAKKLNNKMSEVIVENCTFDGCGIEYSDTGNSAHDYAAPVRVVDNGGNANSVSLLVDNCTFKNTLSDMDILLVDYRDKKVWFPVKYTILNCTPAAPKVMATVQ